MTASKARTYGQTYFIMGLFFKATVLIILLGVSNRDHWLNAISAYPLVIGLSILICTFFMFKWTGDVGVEILFRNQKPFIAGITLGTKIMMVLSLVIMASMLFQNFELEKVMEVGAVVFVFGMFPVVCGSILFGVIIKKLTKVIYHE